MSTERSASLQAIGGFDGLCYGSLGFALAFLALPLYVLLPSHYATQHAVPLSTLGVVLLLTRGLDALVDPFIGRAVDGVFARAPGAAWRAALAAAGVLGLGFVALFFAPLSGQALLVWLVVSLLATYLAFSVLSVVHQAWGVRLGGDATTRARIVGWREGWGVIGALAASVVPLYFGMGVASAVLWAALALGMVMLALAPQGPSPEAGSPESAARWSLPWQSTRFRGLMAVFMLNGIASAVPATLVLFFVRDRLQLNQAEPLLLGAYFASAMLSVPLWVRAVRAWGLVSSWLIGMALAVLSFGWVMTLGVGDQAGFLAVCVASGIALGADLTIPGALLTGVVQQSGHAAQAEGVFTGWWTAATKLNLGLAAGLSLPLLALAGYTPGQRSAQALQALSWAYVAVPCGLKLCAAVLLWRWHANARGDE